MHTSGDGLAPHVSSPGRAPGRASPEPVARLGSLDGARAPPPRCGLRVAPDLWVFNRPCATRGPDRPAGGRPPQRHPRLSMVIIRAVTSMSGCYPAVHTPPWPGSARPRVYAKTSILAWRFPRSEVASSRVPVGVGLVSVEAPSPLGLTGLPWGVSSPWAFRVELFVHSAFPRIPFRYRPSAGRAPDPSPRGEETPSASHS